MTWLNSHGKMISHITIRLPIYVGTHHPAPGTTTEDPACAQARK